MNQSVEIPINRYEILDAEYSAFEFLGLKDNFLQKGDILTLIEVDSVGSPTGNSFLSAVVFVVSSLVVPLDPLFTYYYCDRSAQVEGIGVMIIEDTFIVG